MLKYYNKFTIYILIVITLGVYLPFVYHGVRLPTDHDELNYIQWSFRATSTKTVTSARPWVTVPLALINTGYYLYHKSLGDMDSPRDMITLYSCKPQDLLINGRWLMLITNVLIVIMLWLVARSLSNNLLWHYIIPLMWLFNPNSMFQHKTHIGSELFSTLLVCLMLYVLFNNKTKSKAALFWFMFIAGVAVSHKISLALTVGPMAFFYFIWLCADRVRDIFRSIISGLCGFFVGNPVLPFRFHSAMASNVEHVVYHAERGGTAILHFNYAFFLNLPFILLGIYYLIRYWGEDRKMDLICLSGMIAGVSLLFFSVPDYFTLNLIPLYIVIAYMVLSRHKARVQTIIAVVVFLPLTILFSESAVQSYSKTNTEKVFEKYIGYNTPILTNSRPLFDYTETKPEYLWEYYSINHSKNKLVRDAQVAYNSSLGRNRDIRFLVFYENHKPNESVIDIRSRLQDAQNIQNIQIKDYAVVILAGGGFQELMDPHVAHRNDYWNNARDIILKDYNLEYYNQNRVSPYMEPSYLVASRKQ